MQRRPNRYRKGSLRVCEKYKKTFENCRHGMRGKRSGEAKDADVGLALGDGNAVFFKNGKVFRTVSSADVVTEFIKEIQKLI